MNTFIKNFNIVVNNIIKSISNNDKININLFKCEYTVYNKNNKQFFTYNNILCFCLGGMAYELYYDILNKYYQNINLISNTEDYDFSFCLINNSDENKKILIENINDIFNNSIRNYQFEFMDDNKRVYKINKSNFKLDFFDKKDRMQFVLNFTYNNKKFHILELCFWYNGKVSDNYTINDFIKDKLFIYTNKENLNYYLLPLEKLIKTTYYALLDNYEKQNYSKCNKYLFRIKYIKQVYSSYYENYNNENNNELLNFIFKNYMRDIYHKYKIMFDYPFINSLLLVDIKNDKEILKCVIREQRTESHLTYIKNIQKYISNCNNKQNKLQYDELTEEDTENNFFN